MGNRVITASVRDRMPSQDLEEIEMGSAYRPRCGNCKCRQERHMKIIRDTDELGQETIIRTVNETGVCVNPKCFRYIDQTKTPSWVRVGRAVELA